MIEIFPNIEQASSAAVDHILHIVREAVSKKGFCTLVLAGGKTPKLTYTLLGSATKTGPVPWQQIHFFWGDERWLAPGNPDSNFFSANKNLLTRVSIPPENIHRISTGFSSPETAAEIYEKKKSEIEAKESISKILAGLIQIGAFPFWNFNLLFNKNKNNIFLQVPLKVKNADLPPENCSRF